MNDDAKSSPLSYSVLPEIESQRVVLIMNQPIDCAESGFIVSQRVKSETAKVATPRAKQASRAFKQMGTTLHFALRCRGGRLINGLPQDTGGSAPKYDRSPSPAS